MKIKQQKEDVKVQKTEVKEGKIDKLLAKRSKQQEVETKEQAADDSKSIPASASKIKKTDELLTHKKPATPGAATSLFQATQMSEQKERAKPINLDTFFKKVTSDNVPIIKPTKINARKVVAKPVRTTQNENTNSSNTMKIQGKEGSRVPTAKKGAQTKREGDCKQPIENSEAAAKVKKTQRKKKENQDLNTISLTPPLKEKKPTKTKKREPKNAQLKGAEKDTEQKSV